MAVQPITPDDPAITEQNVIPSFVIEAWNEQIIKNWQPGRRMSRVLDDDVVSAIAKKFQEHYPNDQTEINVLLVNGRGWLHPEKIYFDAGWMVRTVAYGYLFTPKEKEKEVQR